jgi:hypothetical protein
MCGPSDVADRKDVADRADVADQKEVADLARAWHMSSAHVCFPFVLLLIENIAVRQHEAHQY